LDSIAPAVVVKRVSLKFTIKRAQLLKPIGGVGRTVVMEVCAAIAITLNVIATEADSGWRNRDWSSISNSQV
jgi:hypothetical protein